ncbi:MAG: EamA family transporter RarD [Planctomycetota bacterium]
MSPSSDNLRFGFLCAIGAQICWGLFPIYVYFLKSIDAFDFVAHRILWSFSLLIVALFFKSNLPALRKIQWIPSAEVAKETLKSWRILFVLLFASAMIVTNWLLFVWSVMHDHPIDASLGYYLCPQVVVLFGVFLFKEKLTTNQWVGVSIVAAGVAFMFVTSSGMPILSLAIAVSFGLYAATKKKLKLPALDGLTFETGFLFLPAICYVVYRSIHGDAIWSPDWVLNVLLILCGLATITPLALYAEGLKHIRLSTMGLLQFIGPTIQFFLGLFYFQEPFNGSRFLGFLICWTGIGLFLVDLLKRRKKLSS